mgnify:FL=1
MGVLAAGFWAAGVPVKLMGFAEFLLVPALEYPAPKLPVLRKIKDPTPLDYDVHDLMTYNAIAKKEGRPELTYGYWAAAGKPARP